MECTFPVSIFADVSVKSIDFWSFNTSIIWLFSVFLISDSVSNCIGNQMKSLISRINIRLWLEGCWLRLERGRSVISTSASVSGRYSTSWSTPLSTSTSRKVFSSTSHASSAYSVPRETSITKVMLISRARSGC